MSVCASSLAVLALLAGNGDLQRAQQDLQAALNPIQTSRARAAINQLVAINDGAAVRTIATAIPPLTQMQAQLGRQIEEKNRELVPYMERQQVTMEEMQRIQQLQREIAQLQRQFADAGEALTDLKNAFRRFTSEAAAEELLRLLDHRNPELATAAALGLARFPSGPMDERIRTQACRAYRGARDDGLKLGILEILKARRPPTDEVRQIVREALRDRSWRVVLAAAEAVRDLEARELVRDVIEALREADGRLKAELNRVLVALAGYDYGGAYDGWLAWWEQFGEQFVSGNYRRPETRQEGSGGTVRFFGIPIESRRLIFVLDRSGSMETPSGYRRAQFTGGTSLPEGFPREPAGNRKIDILRYEMRLVLTLLPDGTTFNMYAFNHDWTAFQPGLVRLNSSIRAQAIRWIENLPPEGATNLYDPTEAALQMAPLRGPEVRRLQGGIDTIIIFSDGQPNYGKISEPAAIRSAIADLNQSRRVRIDTIFLGSRGEQTFADFLQQIAEQNNGRHVRHLD